MHPQQRLYSRRQFLGSASCAALGSMGMLSTLLNLKLASTASAAGLGNDPGGDDYRALVCVFLSGGNDSFNMILPRGGSAYDEYAAVRGDLALPASSLLPLSPLNYSAKDLGTHPGLRDFQTPGGSSLPGLRSLFESGKAAFVCNLGTLVRPITQADFLAERHLPLGLFSHSDQIEQWQTSIPETRSLSGWAGRIADVLESSYNSDTRVSMNISINGSNLWQSGRNTVEFAVYPGGVEDLSGYEGRGSVKGAAVDNQLAAHYQNVLERTFQRRLRDSIDAYQLVRTATEYEQGNDPLDPYPFPDNYLGDQLRMVVRCISGRGVLGHRRQTFFVELGGWDHHDEVLNNQSEMLPMVSEAVAAFQNALEGLGLSEKVTLFSASDFGRTLTSNGQGSDHAWAGHHFVVGGAVKGRRLFGRESAGGNAALGFYPDLALGNPLDTEESTWSRGRLIPTISVDEYFAELALWFGVPRSDLHRILPNIGNFVNLSQGTAPLGFLL